MPYFSSSTRILIFRNDTGSPWSWRQMWPLLAMPKFGILTNLLLATRSFQSSLPLTYSQYFTPSIYLLLACELAHYKKDMGLSAGRLGRRADAHTSNT